MVYYSSFYDDNGIENDIAFKHETTSPYRGTNTPITLIFSFVFGLLFQTLCPSF